MRFFMPSVSSFTPLPGFHAKPALNHHSAIAVDSGPATLAFSHYRDPYPFEASFPCRSFTVFLSAIFEFNARAARCSVRAAREVALSLGDLTETISDQSCVRNLLDQRNRRLH